jgi:hypothetical protein
MLKPLSHRSLACSFKKEEKIASHRRFRAYHGLRAYTGALMQGLLELPLRLLPPFQIVDRFNKFISGIKRPTKNRMLRSSMLMLQWKYFACNFVTIVTS